MAGAAADRKKPWIIGITGTIGSGKSSVGRILEARGIPVIDSDKVVHELLGKNTPVRKAVIERFGDDISDKENDGAIDRVKLGKKVFEDEAARKDLEAIVHPAVILECRRQALAHSNQPLVAILAPLLFEAGLGKNEYDEIWSVFASEEVLKERIKQRDRLSDQEVENRIAAQWSQERKAKLADHVIDNSGNESETRRQVDLLVEKLLSGSRA